MVVDTCDSAGTCGIESALWALLCVFVGFVWVTVCARLRVTVDGGRGLRWSLERGIVVWPVRSLYPARPSRNRRISAFSLACSLVNALGLVAVSSVSAAVVAVSGSVGAVAQEASPAEVSKRELVSMLGDRDRVVPSTHVFLVSGLSSATSSPPSSAVRFFPFSDTVPPIGLLTKRDEGVNSIGVPILVILCVLGVVSAAFASFAPSTARRFMGDEVASIVEQINEDTKENPIECRK